MTIIIGLKHKGNVWIGADSRITEGDGTKFDLDLTLDSKLFKLSYCVIGFAGDLSAKSFMESFLLSGKRKMAKVTDRASVIKFFQDFRSYLKSKQGLDESDLSKIDVSWLVATKDNLYICDGDGAVLGFPNFCAIGTGATTARAALEYIELHDAKLNPQERLARAHEITVRHNSSCGGVQEVYCVSDIAQR